MNGTAALTPHWRARFWTGLAVFMLLMMETTVTALWYQAIFARERSWGVVFGLLFAIFATSYLLPRAMDRLGWKPRARQAAIIAWIALAGLASLKVLIFPTAPMSLGALINVPLAFILRSGENAAGFFHLLAMILLVWRGVHLSRYPLTLNVVQFSFQASLISLLLYGMFYAPLHPREAVLGLYLFLFCGLTAMSLSRIANLSETRGGRVPRFGLGWLASIVLAGLAIVGLAVLAGWASSGQVVDWVVRLFIIVLGVLTALVLLIFSPLLLWMAQFIPALAEFINQFLARFRNMPVFEEAARLLERLNEGMARLIPYIRAGRGLLLAGILLALAIIVMLGLYLRRIARELVEEEEPQKAEPDPDGLTLRKFLQRLLKDARSIRLRRPAQILAAARIRQIYRHLMKLSQNLGAPRPPSVTPLEFLPQLQGLFPEERGGLERITGAYVSVRYGDYPETAAEVEEIQAAWERIRRQGRRMLAVRRRRKGEPLNERQENP